MPSAKQYSDPLTRNDIGLLVLRVAVGLTLCWDGLNVVFASEQFKQLGSTAGASADLAARVLAGTYSIGGALLVAGLLTPLGGCAVLGSMLYAATLSYSVRHDLLQSGTAVQFPLLLAAAAMAVTSVLVVAGFGAAIAAWVLVKGTNPLS